MSSRMKLLVVAVAVAVAFPLSAAAGARSSTAQAKGLSVADAPRYLDVGDTLPASFRELTPDEVVERVGESPENFATTAYESDELGAYIVLHLGVGKGKISRAIFAEMLDHPEEIYPADDLAAYISDTELPDDEISVTPGEWSDAAVGDTATTGLYTINIAGEPAVRFEVLLALVGRGNDTALVEVDHLFAAVPAVDVTEVARTIAENIETGPPDPELRIAEAGFVSLDDLPAGYREVRDAADTASGPSNSTGTGDGLEQTVAIAKRIPECKKFVALFGAEAAPSLTKAGTTGLHPVVGPTFGSGGARVTGQVTVYPTEASARAGFGVMGDRSTKACLSKLYEKVVRTAAGSKDVTVKVTTPRGAAVGDARVLYVVTADFSGPLGDIQFIAEQEFVRVGRAVGGYTFTGTDGTTPREQALPFVADRLDSAPGVR